MPQMGAFGPGAVAAAAADGLCHDGAVWALSRVSEGAAALLLRRGGAVDWAVAVGIAVGVVIALWVVLVVLARRLPPGLARELAAFLPACVGLARTLRRDPAVPRRAKLALRCV